MRDYYWLIFLLIVVFLLVRNADTVKSVITALSHGQIGAIVALQGGNPGQFINQVGA